MCDLNPEESAYIRGALADITALIGQANANAESIADRSFMDHETVSLLLHQVADKARKAASWVAAKPHEHAGHA
jgi:hypothetical protein